MRRSPLLLGLALVLTASPLRAQSIRDFVGYLALTNTPQGALPASSFGADALSAGGSLDLRYGRIDYGDGDAFNNGGLTFSAPLSALRLGGTVGVVTCDGCDGLLMLGLDAEIPVLKNAAGTEAQLTVGLQPAVGFAKSLGSGDGTILSGSVGLPIGITSGSSLRVNVFVAPGFGYGRLSGGGESESGTRPMVGAGLRLRSTSGFGALVGLQKVFIDEGETQFGVGVSWTGGAR